MHLWNTSEVARKLRAGTVTETQVFHSFLVVSVLSALHVNWLFLSWKNLVTLPAGLQALALVAIVVAGSTWAFRANGGERGEQFVVRYTCLSVPLSLRLILLKIGIHLLYALPMQWMARGRFVASYWSFTLMEFLLLGGFYLRLHHHFQVIARDSE